MGTANSNEKRVLLVAIGLTLALLLIPYGRWLTYPFLIFATFVHETCHALATVLTGGKVESITVALDGSGLTLRQGGFGLIVVPAGYIGTALIGGLLLILSRNRARTRPVLLACAAFIAIATAGFAGHSNNWIVFLGFLMMTAMASLSRKYGRIFLAGTAIVAAALCFYLFSTGSLFSWAAGLVIVGSLILVACFTSPGFAHFFLTFLAVQCSLNSLNALLDLTTLSVHSNVHTDAQTMASMTFIPAIVWAIAWALIAILILILSARTYFLAGRKSAKQPAL
jgi:Peptidase M50B-like